MKAMLVVIAIALMGSASFAAPAEDGAAEMKLRALLDAARERDAVYVTPAMETLAAFHESAKQIIDLLAKGVPPSATPALLTELGFAVVPTSLGGAPAVALLEIGAHRGSGFFVLRAGVSEHERIVQVPHSFFDEGTLEIGLELAEVGGARALFINTVHRFQAGRPPKASLEGDSPVVSPSDLAHQVSSFFQEMTELALGAWPTAEIVQVHGFAAGATGPRSRAEVVVSQGIATAGIAEAARVAERLGTVFGPKHVLLFPRDTRLLGATLNAQGKAVSRHPPAIFVHLELSSGLRERLVADRKLRRKFAEAVFGALAP